MNKPIPPRRRFLGQAGALALGAAATPLVPATARTGQPTLPKGKRPTLVCIFLRGGADALNVVVPHWNDLYYAIRPNIAIPREAENGRPGVVDLDGRHGLHPALSPLKPLWDAGQLAPILNVGSPHPTRSHFDAQDFMEYAAPGDRSVKDGWLNRYLTSTATQDDDPLRAVAIQGLLPRSLRGRYPVLAVPRLTRGNSEGLLDLFDDVYKDTGAMDPMMRARKLEGGAEAGRKAAVQVGRDTIKTLRHFWDVTEASKSKARYPRHGLARQLQKIAQLIHSGEGLEIAALDTGGWDTHQGEGSTNGTIARLLRAVGESLAAFATDLGPKMDDTMVLVMTEFGRNAAENGNEGTDHGRGSCMLAMGGRVNGGKVYGDYGTLEPKQLVDGRDLRCDIDFRTVFDESLRKLFAFEANKDFFPIWSGREHLGFVKNA